MGNCNSKAFELYRENSLLTTGIINRKDTLLNSLESIKLVRGTYIGTISAVVDSVIQYIPGIFY